MTGETEYKPWSGPFGSARPIRGLGYRTLICQVEPEWDKAVLMMERELLEMQGELQRVLQHVGGKV